VQNAQLRRGFIVVWSPRPAQLRLRVCVDDGAFQSQVTAQQQNAIIELVSDKRATFGVYRQVTRPADVGECRQHVTVLGDLTHLHTHRHSKKVKQMIYIAVLSNREITAEPLYNTPLVHWTHAWLPHN